MRTVRIEASRGYCGCRHELMRPCYGNRRMTLSRYRSYRYGWLGDFINMLVRIFAICAMLISIFAFCYEVIMTQRSFTSVAIEENIYDEADNVEPLSVTGAVAGVRISQIIEDAKINVEQVQEDASSVALVEAIDDPPVVEEIDVVSIITENIGSDTIDLNDVSLKRYDLPDVYYPGLDFSSFQPYMGYDKVTNKKSPAYAITHSELAYTDENGIRRYKTTEDQFTIEGKDDYIIALGTFYKEKGTAGGRYLIVTSTGMYTAITGDEKADIHTDSRNMFSLHADGSFAGIIEWIVDTKNLDRAIKRAGSITAGPDEVLQGEILYIYGIE